MIRYFAVGALAVALLTACAAQNPHYDPSKPHHTIEGFRNNYPHPEKGSFWAWKWEQWRLSLPIDPPSGGWRFGTLAQGAQAFRGNHPEHRVTWVGHATVLVQVGPVNILTDPQFSDRASPVGFAGPKRVVPSHRRWLTSPASTSSSSRMIIPIIWISKASRHWPINRRLTAVFCRAGAEGLVRAAWHHRRY